MSYARILLLEDDRDLRDLLTEVLIDHEYEVEAVSSGEQAIKRAFSESFDLIVADIRMAGISGLDAMARVKESQPDIGTLVMTGYASEEDSIRAIQLGVGNYLKKPFKTKDFLASVQALLARRRKAQRQQQREQALRQTALWALESMARSLDLSADSSLVENGRRAERAARVLGASREMAMEVQLACLLRSLQRQDSCPDYLAQAVPDSVLGLLEQLGDGAATSLPARVLNALETGQEDPEVAAALAGEPVTAETETGAHPRHLLSLGRALADRGEVASASEAFARVLEHTTRVSREAVEARLALSELARVRGDSQEAQRLALQASDQALELGPTWGGDAFFESALVLVQTGHPLGASRLAEAHQRAGPGTALEARTCLARAHYFQQATPEQVQAALGVLMRPDHLDQLAASSRWLLPALLEQQGRNPNPTLGRALAVLARDLPHGLQQVLESDLSPGARRAAQELAPETAGGPVLRLHSLGGFEVFRGDDLIVEWRSQKARYLLALVAAHAGRPISEDLLQETFWPEDPTRSRQNLNATVSMVRKATGLNPLVRTSAGMVLNPELPRWHDLEELEKALAQAASSEGPALEPLIRAARLYRGPYLDGCYMDWALARRQRLENQMLAALGRLSLALLSQDRPGDALEFARLGLEIDSCCQEAHQAAMRAHLALGQAEQAVRQFEICRATLQRELQMEPSIALLELHQRARLSLA